MKALVNNIRSRDTALRFIGSADPIRLGIFAAIHGDEPAGALAVVKLLQELAQQPEWAANYHIKAYPICNPTGFEDNTRESRRGKDLNREFWRGSQEPEVQILENELRSSHFDGLIQLHADDTSDGVYGFVRGHTLTEHLLRPALEAVEKSCPGTSAQPSTDLLRGTELFRGTTKAFSVRPGKCRRNRLKLFLKRRKKRRWNCKLRRSWWHCGRS